MGANAAQRLLQHYVDNFRRLPWRSPPGEPRPDVYRVWLSEVMLQQTTVAAVAPRFERFLERWPTVEALAAAPAEEVLSEWAGLGYYARARNLIACARVVVDLGGFTGSERELRRLPGVGAYTAAAIAAIAHGEDTVPVDTNVERVIARVNAIRAPGKTEVTRLAKAMAPPGRSGDFAQALMDLGATICRPKAPRCAICPIRADCSAFASGNPERFPEGKSRAVRPRRFAVAWWIERDDCVWLVRRPPNGMLGGMAALPGEEWSDSPPSLARQPLGTVRHVFTHFVLDLHLVACRDAVGEGWWQPLSGLDRAGLPTLYRRAAAVALAAAMGTDRAAA